MPVPSEVWLSLVVGLADILQQTPLAVTEALPSEVTLPPLEALLAVIEDTAVVATVGVVPTLTPTLSVLFKGLTINNLNKICLYKL